MKILRHIGVLATTGASAILGMVLGIIAFNPTGISIVKNNKEEESK